MQQRDLNIGILIGDVPTDPEFSPTLRPNYHLAVSLKQLPGNSGPISDGKRKPASVFTSVFQAAYRYNLRTFSLSFHDSTQLISQWQREVRGSTSYRLVAAALLPSSKVNNKSKTAAAAAQDKTTDIRTPRRDRLFQSGTFPVPKGPQTERTACAAALISSSASGVGCIIVKSQKLDKGEAGMLGAAGDCRGCQGGFTES